MKVVEKWYAQGAADKWQNSKQLLIKLQNLNHTRHQRNLTLESGTTSGHCGC